MKFIDFEMIGILTIGDAVRCLRVLKYSEKGHHKEIIEQMFCEEYIDDLPTM